MKEEIIEGLLFIRGDIGITLKDIVNLLNINKDEAMDIINNLDNKYQENSGIVLRKFGDYYKLSTKEEYSDYYKSFFSDPRTRNLTDTSLEVLSIIAFSGPLTIREIDEFRGVSSRELVNRLRNQGLVEEKGKSEEIGRATLFGVTEEFLDFFGLKSMDSLKELKIREEEKELEEENK